MGIDLRRLPDFPASTRDDWTAAAERALGTLPLDRIVRRTADGIALPPLTAPARDHAPLELRPSAAPWTIAATVPAALADANAILLDELAGGAGALDLEWSPAAAGALTAERLDAILDGVSRPLVSVHLPQAAPAELVATLAATARRGGGFAGARLHAGHDPVVASSGLLPAADARPARARLGDLDALGAGSTAFAARGQVWHALGASDAQQLGIAVATGIAVLDRIAAEGGDDADLGRAAGAIEFRLVADQEFFQTIARLRAFRRLWARVLDLWGLPQVPALVHAEPAFRMMTRRDPWVNILRMTIAVAGAALGGADIVGSRAHTAPLGRPDADARRLARNIQAILMEESGLALVGDPAAGAGGLEALTDSFAAAAWDELRRIDAEGGLDRSIAGGALAARIASADAAVRKLVATRRQPVTGTSTWPLLDEPSADPGGEPELQPPVAGATRLAEPWEALRDRSDAVLTATGRRPTVFVVALGPASAHVARMTWMRNLLEAGGFACVVADGPSPTAMDGLGRAFRASGAAIAALASSDAIYADLAAPAAAALREGGAAEVLLAGRGGDFAAALTAAGISRFVFDGQDMLAVLADLQSVAAR